MVNINLLCAAWDMMLFWVITASLNDVKQLLRTIIIKQ